MAPKDHIKQALRPCPVCLSGAVEVLHHQRFTLPEGHLLGDGYDVVSCSACCFVYADTAAKQADYEPFYAELSRYESTVSSGSGLSPSDLARLRETASDVARAVPAKDARVSISAAPAAGCSGR